MTLPWDTDGPRRSAVSDVLRGIYENALGYGRGELDCAADLESEAGVDSLRQAELAAQVTDHFGLNASEDFATLQELRVLDDMTDFVTRRLSDSAR
ncbi:acyl carrier protein [Streptomyces sp. NPDC054796]